MDETTPIKCIVLNVSLNVFQFYSVDGNQCATRPCVNGECVDAVNGYICNCFPGYTGTNCDINISKIYEIEY